MRDYVIMSDVNCDVLPSYAEEKGIAIFPQYYHFNDGVIYGDEIKLTPQQFYARLAKERAYSMGCNPERVRGIMEEALKEGHDIIAIMASSGCSGSYNTVLTEANELMELYPGSKIHVVDTLLEAAGAGLLVSMAVDLKEAGKTLEENALVLERRKYQCDVFFVIDHLDYLVRGGRVSPLSGAVGSVLQIKPVLHFEDGKIVPLMKCRGRKAAKKALLDMLAKKKLDKRYFIGAQTECMEEEKEYVQKAREMFGVEPLYIGDVSLIIGTHVGPDALGFAVCEAE